jgi:Mg2+ and Co2+ transporter CorA
MKRISRKEVEELYSALIENLASHAYGSIMDLLDEIERLVDEGRLTPELIDLLWELLSSLNMLLSGREEVEGEGRELVDESLREGFSMLAELADWNRELIEDAVEVLTELYSAKELLDRIQRRIVSLLDSLRSCDELVGRGLPDS